MIKAILIEDEINARESLKKIISYIDSSIEIIGESGFVKEGIELINSLNPDVVFLDIELEDGTSFDVLNRLNNRSFQIIFTTAYNQHAIKAFKFSAIDYLLKPIDPEELKQAIDRVKANIDKENRHQDLIEVLNNNIENKEEKLVLKTADNRYVLNVKNVIHLIADGSYTHFITSEKKITVSKNLKFYEDILGNTFIRCHQSHLVNSNHIKSIEKNNFIKVSNSDLIPISTRKRKEIVEFLNSF